MIIYFVEDLYKKFSLDEYTILIQVFISAIEGEIINFTSTSMTIKKISDDGAYYWVGYYERVPYVEYSGGNNGSGGSSGDDDTHGYVTCTLCKGDGECYRCYGDGYIYQYGRDVKCSECNGSGICKRCNGSGKVSY